MQHMRSPRNSSSGSLSMSHTWPSIFLRSALYWGCIVFVLSVCAPLHATSKQPAQASVTTPATIQQPLIRFAAVGDIMMGTENALPENDGAGLFADAKPFLVQRDVVFGNLESPLTNMGTPQKPVATGRFYVFRTPPRYGSYLKDAGFTMLSLANNHSNDYGPQGRAQTRAILKDHGIQHTGAVGQVAVQYVKGVRIAFIGLAPNLGCQNINDIPAVVKMVRREAQQPNSLVVVSFHGGAEGAAHLRLPDGPETYLGEKRGDLRRLAHAVIDAGAALVLGHGPHVPRGLEVYKGRLIAYSLGNFATSAGINIRGVTGLAPLLLADLALNGELVSMKIVSFRQEYNKGPKLDPTNEVASLIRALSKEMLAPKWEKALHKQE